MMDESKKKYKALPWLAYLLWILLLVGLALPARFILTTLDKDLPSFEDLENPQYDEASIVYDAKGTSFGKYYVENRVNVQYKDLSPLLVNTLLSTEDIRFHKHSGIDLKALFRVAFKTVLLRKESSGGGSTISQQLAKLLFKRPSLANKSKMERVVILLRTKVAEWITAVRLERSYTKEEIITMYLNKFEFINGAHGIQAAAQTYFNKNQEDLAVNEAALLVGMLKNPSLYNPLRFPENATQRRDIVFNQLEKHYDVAGLGIDTMYGKLVDMSSFEREAHDVGPAPYFRSELTKWLRDLFDKNDITKPDGTPYNIYTDGLKIYTTIDLNYQKHAEAAVRKHMTWLQDVYWNVWKRDNPWTFEADSLQLIIREKTLERKLKETERYIGMHDSYLGKAKTAAQKKFGGISLSENVIKSLIKIEKRVISWSSSGISKDDRKAYEKLMDDALWSDLKENYSLLQKDYRTVFKKKRQMQVFAYNDNGYKEVEMSPRDSVRYHNQHLQASLLAVHPLTGHIKAWVGGPGFSHFKYDHVNSRRQVGSTIKPFVYATAISLMGLSPCQEYEDIQYTIPPGDANFNLPEAWSPGNANEEFTGNKYNLYQGLLYSKNSITVKLVKEMGNVDVVLEMLDNAGISKDNKHPNGEKVIPEVPAISLGAVDLTLHEMAGAYTTFANSGRYTEPIFISKIEDKSGKIIYTGVPESKQAINPLYNGVMVDMLKNNVGGGYKLGVKSQLGGKTGTTNDYADGWFMSVAPELVTGVWVGGDDKWIRFKTLQNGQGYVMARPVVQQFLQAIEADTLVDFNYEAEFPSPPIGYLDLVDCDKYKQKSVEEEQELNKLAQRSDDFDNEFSEFEEEFEDEFGEEEIPDSLRRQDSEFEDEFEEEEKPATKPAVDTAKIKKILKKKKKQTKPESGEQGGGDN